MASGTDTPTFLPSLKASRQMNLPGPKEEGRLGGESERPLGVQRPASSAIEPVINLNENIMALHTSNGKPLDGARIYQPYTIDSTKRLKLQRMPFHDLHARHPTLNESVIDGWIREREVANIIAAPKLGKSWLALYIALCIVTGEPVFGRHRVKRGKVLLIDLELHQSVIVDRVVKVAAALGIAPEDFDDQLDIEALRGNWMTMDDLLSSAADIPLGEYVALIVDSKYRLEGSGDENANSDITAFYNRADQLAEMTGAAVLFVHHQTKGDQSSKRVTDIGSGGGAQSRAADTHLVLREHEEHGVAVIEAAVRSFPPVKPLAIRWQFPLWVVDEEVNIKHLAGKKTRGEQRVAERDREGMDLIVSELKEEPSTMSTIRSKTGISKDRCDRLLKMLEASGRIAHTLTNARGNNCRRYHVVDE